MINAFIVIILIVEVKMMKVIPGLSHDDNTWLPDLAHKVNCSKKLVCIQIYDVRIVLKYF